MPSMFEPATGRVVDVPPEQIEQAIRAGYKARTADDERAAIEQEVTEEKTAGVGAGAEALVAGALRGATLGLSDVAAAALGTKADTERLAELRRGRPGLSTIGEIGGAVAPALLTGGTGALGAAARATPAGALSRAALGLGERATALAGGGTGAYVAGTALGAAAEGAIQNVGSYVADVALENKDISAEGFLASAKQGALWAGVAGGALAGIERGTIAARRLFPRSVAKDREAVQLIEQDFLAKADDTIKAGDELEKVARSTLDDLRIRSLELNLEREKLRHAADPSPAAKIRIKEIDLERAKISAARKALRAQQNAERAAQGLPDIPPEVQAPSPPPLDEASVVPRGPPAEAAAPTPTPEAAPLAEQIDAVTAQDAAAAAGTPSPPLASTDSLEARLAATKGLLDEGVPFQDIGAAAQGQVDDLAIAAGNTAHEAGMLADDAVKGGEDAAARLAAKVEDYAARKQAVKDWIAKYKPGAKYDYTSSLTGESLAGGAPRRTDRARVMGDGEFEAIAGDRVYAGIGQERDVLAPTPEAAAAADLATQPPAVAAPRTFEQRFQEAFAAADAASGKNNYVLMSDLRAAMPDIDRATFDAELNKLRRAKMFSLDSADGRHVRLTPEQQEASIREAGSILAYVQKGRNWRPLEEASAAASGAPATQAFREVGDDEVIAFGKAFKQLDDDASREAIRKWQTSTVLQKNARSDGLWKEFATEQRKQLEKVIESGRLPRDTRLYRGVGASFDSSHLKPGSVMSSEGFLATSTNRDVAETFMTLGKPQRGIAGTMFEIDAPAGAPSAWASSRPGEREVLFGRRAKLQVLDVRTEQADEGLIRVIRARIEPPAAASPRPASAEGGIGRATGTGGKIQIVGVAAERAPQIGKELTDLVGRPMTLDDFVGAYKMPDGWSLKVDNAGPAPGARRGVNFYADIIAPDGKVAGALGRTIRRGDDGVVEVLHNDFQLKPGYMKHGLGPVVSKSSLEAYPKLGIQRIQIPGATDVGRYYWMKQGYKPDPDEVEAIVEQFGKWLAKDKALAPQAEKLLKKAERLLKQPGGIADMAVGGRRIGKEFLLSEDGPSYGLSLTLKPNDKWYKAVRRNLGIDEAKAPVDASAGKAAATEADAPVVAAAEKAPPRRSGAELDAAYDDLIEQASNAATREEMLALAKQAGEIEDQILDRVAARGGREADEVAKIRAKRAEYNWTSADVAARRAEKLGIAKATGDGPVPLSGRAKAAADDLDAYDRALRRSQFEGGKTAGEVADEILRGSRVTEAAAPGPGTRTISAGGKELRLEAKTRRTIDGGSETTVTAYRTLSDGEEVESATAVFRHRGDELAPRNVTVEPALRRKGIASEMYAMAEEQTGKRIIPSETQTDEGRALSAAYRSRRDARTASAAPESGADEILAGARAAETAAPAPGGTMALEGAGVPVAPPPSGLGRFIDDADEAIRLVGEYERAQFELAQELGAAAPPAVQQHAAQYAAALDGQARKSTEAIAAQADQSAQAAALPSAAAATDVKKGTQLVSLPKAPAVPTSEPKNLAGRIADAAGFLDLIGVAGATSIPVIGPFLGTYLKYRGLKAVWHRLGGRIPATANAKIAARAAEIRDKAATIVDGILEGAGKAAKGARAPAVVGGVKLLDTLKHSLYPDGQERKEAKGPAEAAKARVAELSAVAANPDAARAAIRRQVGDADPDMAAAIEAATMRKLLYLQRHAPKQPPPGPFGAKAWTPSAAEVDRFARRIRAAEDPMSVLEDVERGKVTPEAAEALREVYPSLFAEVQTRLLTRAAELEAKLPYQRLIHLSLLFDAPLDDSLKPENLALLQQTSQQAASDPAATPVAGQPASSVAAPVHLSSLYETSEVRRANRR